MYFASFLSMGLGQPRRFLLRLSKKGALEVGIAAFSVVLVIRVLIGVLIGVLMGVLMGGCAADRSYVTPIGAVSGGGIGEGATAQTLDASELMGAHISFKSPNFFTSFNPRPSTNCAGDANTFYDPFALNALGAPLPLSQNIQDSTTTIRPSFVKNVSVDMTDSNLILPANKSLSCSYGQNAYAPPASNCATFDNVEDAFVSLSTTTDQKLLVGALPLQNPYYVPSGDQIILSSALMESTTIILPPAALNAGQTLFIEKTDPSNNPVTIQTQGSDTIIDLFATVTGLTGQYQYVSLTSSATNSTTGGAAYYWGQNSSTATNPANSINSNYTQPTLTNDTLLSVDASSGSVEITLPDATASHGNFLSIQKTDASGNTVVIEPSGADQIEDQNGNIFSASTPFTLATPYSATATGTQIVLLAIQDAAGIYYWTTQNPNPAASTSPYPIVNGNQVILVDAINSDVSLSLPSATVNPGKTVVVERLDSSTHTVTLNTIPGETLIDLSTTSTTLTVGNPLLTLVSTVTALDATTYYWEVTTGVAYRASTGYNSAYYTTLDKACIQGGPVVSSDSTINSILVGGAYFDIDRTQLGPDENLLLNLTFYPLDTTTAPLNGDSAQAIQVPPIVKVHLVETGQSGDTIRSTTQPRILTYGSTTEFPQLAQDLAVIGVPTGQIQQQQIFLPISINPAIDRIHVQRYSGDIIFIDATLFRMGYR